MEEKKLPLYSIALLIVLAIVVIVLRLHSLGEPLERDITSYGYFAHEMLGGAKLYTYLLDHHPPGVYVVYMLAEWVFGYGPLSVAALGIIFSLLSLLFIFLLLKEISNVKTALLGALFWALASNSVPLEANQPNTELFMNVFTIIAIWGIARFGLKGKAGLTIAGFFLAIASVFKMVVFFPFLALFIYVIIFSLKEGRAEGRTPWPTCIRRLFILSIPGFWVWALVFFYFIVQGRFSDFFGAVFIFNTDYSGSIAQNLILYFTSLVHFFHISQREIFALAILSLLFFFTGTKEHGPFKRSFFILFIIATMIEVASPGHFFPHYYQLFLPMLSIMSALFVYDLYSLVERKNPGSALIVTAIALILPIVSLVYYQGKFLSTPPNEISEAKYMTMFTESLEMANYIKERTEPCETIYVYGQDTGVYYYSERRAATGIIFVTILFFGSEAERYEKQKNFYDQIINEPPSYFIWDLRYGKIQENIFYRFLSERYDFIGRRFSRYLVYELKERRDASGRAICAKGNSGT
jgi:4-amino-4-deoxy-L-arabinose transferase-like glycosyltransferase